VIRWPVGLLLLVREPLSTVFRLVIRFRYLVVALV